MASCLADGFFPSRLICKIKNFFDVFSHFFHIFVGAGRAENMQENTNACGYSGNVPAGIFIGAAGFAGSSYTLFSCFMIFLMSQTSISSFRLLI